MLAPNEHDKRFTQSAARICLASPLFGIVVLNCISKTIFLLLPMNGIFDENVKNFDNSEISSTTDFEIKNENLTALIAFERAQKKKLD